MTFVPLFSTYGGDGNVNPFLVEMSCVCVVHVWLASAPKTDFGRWRQKMGFGSAGLGLGSLGYKERKWCVTWYVDIWIMHAHMCACPKNQTSSSTRPDKWIYYSEHHNNRQNGKVILCKHPPVFSSCLPLKESHTVLGCLLIFALNKYFKISDIC